jgi:hypothetical protein
MIIERRGLGGVAGPLLGRDPGLSAILGLLEAANYQGAALLVVGAVVGFQNSATVVTWASTRPAHTR